MTDTTTDVRCGKCEADAVDCLACLSCGDCCECPDDLLDALVEEGEW